MRVIHATICSEKTRTVLQEDTVRTVILSILNIALIFTASTEASLSNPNTTREGRKHAKRELKHMVSYTP